jgi:hypothetical protein
LPASDHTTTLPASAQIDKAAFKFHKSLLYGSESSAPSQVAHNRDKSPVQPADTAAIASSAEDQLAVDMSPDSDWGIMIGDDASCFRSRRSSPVADLKLPSGLL